MKTFFTLLAASLFLAISNLPAQTPTLFSSSPDYCEGEPGTTFGVENTVLSDPYTLQKGPAPWQTLAVIVGNGGTVNFPGNYGSGIYRLQQFPEQTITITQLPLPEVDFTYIQSGPPDGCGLVHFNTTVNGIINPETGYTYVWTFGNTPGTDSIPNPAFRFPAYGTGDEDFTVELKVLDGNGCETIVTNTVTVTQRPHADLTPQYGLWMKCDSDPNAQFLLKVFNTSPTHASNTFYLIDWGDGSPIVNLTPAEFPLNGELEHLYTEKGMFYLTITVFGPICNDTRVYPVFNGSNPAGGIMFQPGSLEGCAPHNITFMLSGDSQYNSPGTHYSFDFGDGYTLVFTQETMPPLHPDGYFPITHTYTFSSCEEPDHSFSLTCIISNPCATITMLVSGIKISEKASADFLRNEFPDDPIYVCVNQPRVFNNQTSEGCIIFGNNIITATNYYWDIGNNGIIDTQEENPVFTFDTPGTFEVRLTAITGEGIPNCGEDFIIREVCVQDIPQPSFHFEQSAYCINEVFSPENTSITSPDCAIPYYMWIISPDEGYFFTGGTNSSSFEPQLLFYQDGEYSITLRIRLYSGFDQCLEEFSNPTTITIQALPDVTLQAFDLICLQAPPFELSGGTPEGGIYSGNGVIDNWFYPEIAGPGIHSITYSFTDDNGCTGMAVDSIFVDPCSGVLMPENIQAINIHPNPSKGTFTISAQIIETTTINIKINSLLGKTVFNETNLVAGNNFIHEVRLQNLNPGLYIVMIFGDSLNEMRKIVIH